MARSIWNGTIAFGLMTVPVKLHTATESKTVRFNEVHLDDGARIEHRRFCSKEDKEVPYEQVVKGYEVREDEYVVLDKDEISAAAGDGAHRIDVEHFVDAGDIDPVFFDKTYYLGAGKDGDVASPSRGPGDREVKMAAQLIDTLHAKFKPDDYEDEYRAAVLKVV